MSVGKYVTNPGVIGAALGALGTAKRTQHMRKDWRRLLIWVVWTAGFALAVSGVAMREQDERFEAEQEAQKKLEKKRKKREKRK